MNDAIHLKYLVAGPNDPIPRPITLPATCSPRNGDASWTNTSCSI